MTAVMTLLLTSAKACIAATAGQAELLAELEHRGLVIPAQAGGLKLADFRALERAWSTHTEWDDRVSDQRIRDFSLMTSASTTNVP